MECPRRLVHRLFFLLQKGVRVKAQIGSSVRHLLITQWGLDPHYVDTHITTIFLDGSAVDDLETVLVRQNSHLALSAAVPGLAGATLRRGGYLGALRSQITHPIHEEISSKEPGFVIVKLFNLLVKELGPRFLGKGIYLPPSDLRQMLNDWPKEPDAGCRVIDQKPLRASKATPLLPGEDTFVLLTVRIAEDT